MHAMAIRPLNLTLDEELIEQVKLQAVRERRSVSEIVAELLREYLGAVTGPRIPVRRSLEHPKKERRKTTK
jgi:plasmid stability protein